MLNAPLNGFVICFYLQEKDGFVRVFVTRNIAYSVVLHVVSGAGRSSKVERSLMVRWVVGSILHGVDPLSYFSFQPVLHDWCNKAVVCVILSVGWCI